MHAQINSNDLSEVDFQLFDHRRESEIRRQQCQELEKDTVAVSQMMAEIQELIELQGESIDQIGENVCRSKDSVDQGHKDLVLASKYQSKYYKYITWGGSILVTALGGPYAIGAKATYAVLAGLCVVPFI